MITAPQNQRILLFSLLAVFFLIAGCAKKTTVVLLPDPDGRVGQVTVSTDIGSLDISQAREATTVTGRDSRPSPPAILSEAAIAADFSPVLTILPERPVHFILYFTSQTTELTAASLGTLPKILASITQRNARDISVIGHTDTAGDRQYNLQLSRKRAAAVRSILIEQGVDPDDIHATSHGEENPLIKTADNVHEPRNRRVEVVVR
jgi:OmpA-OmpF porin, OOP family